MLPTRIREEIYDGLLANDIVGFHTRAYRDSFLQCCRELMGYEIEFERGVVHCRGREVWVRAYPLPIDYEATRAVARSDAVAEFERELLAPPARPPDPARGPGRPVQERAARLHRASTSSSSSTPSSPSG